MEGALFPILSSALVARFLRLLYAAPHRFVCQYYSIRNFVESKKRFIYRTLKSITFIMDKKYGI